MDSVFIRPLRSTKPPVITPLEKLEAFIDEVFSNIHAIRECNRRLLEILHVRQREQAPVVQGVGDILLEAATDFRRSYPDYIGNHPLAEKRLRDELENNEELHDFIDVRYLIDPSQLFNLTSCYLGLFPAAFCLSITS